MAHEREPLRLHVRWMIRRDMRAVLEMEAQCFEFPWREADFTRCLRQANCIGLVADDLATARLAGFVIYENHKTRTHVLSLAVAPGYRRRGVARAMIENLKGKLTPRRQRILLEVRETNLAAQLCFRQLGFRAVSVLRDFYDDTSEDAYLMQYRAGAVPSSSRGTLIFADER